MYQIKTNFSIKILEAYSSVSSKQVGRSEGASENIREKREGGWWDWGTGWVLQRQRYRQKNRGENMDIKNPEEIT